MWLSLQQGSLQLSGDSPVAFRQARGYWVECVEGRVWLTITGQAGDFLLAAGESLRVDSNGLALVAGFPSGTVRLYRESPWPLRSANLLWQRLQSGRWQLACAAFNYFNLRRDVVPAVGRDHGR